MFVAVLLSEYVGRPSRVMKDCRVAIRNRHRHVLLHVVSSVFRFGGALSCFSFGLVVVWFLSFLLLVLLLSFNVSS
jgi:hypothetical protein